MNKISPTAKISPNTKLGKNIRIEDFVIIGDGGPHKKSKPTVIGDNAIIRSHTVIYEGNTIGKNFQTGHGVLIRENNTIGDNVSIGTGSTIEHHINIEPNVRIHSNAFIPEFSKLRRGCWIGPGVVLTNASYPLSPNAKATLQGPVVEEGAKVGGNSSLLPGVIIGKNSLVGAGSVVVKNIEKNKVVAGNPSLEVNNINKLSAYQSSENKRIPLTDLKAQYQEVSTELDAAVRRVLESGIYVSGAEISSFEKNFSTYIGTAYCKGVSSGTSALHLALEAAGIGVGHDVITSPFTFIATAEAIRHSGARTVFVDVNHQTLCLDQNKIEKAITRKTRAIVVVHIHGQPAAMDEILSIAKKHKLLVIEDAAQAHGARYKGRMIGSMGDAGCFSFFPAKNLGACGDAGAVVTNNPKIAERVSLLRDHGRKEKYLHESHGYNHRMDPLQAAILNVKLRYLDEWNQQRRAIADRYTSVLQKFFQTPIQDQYSTPAYHQYTIRVRERDKIQSYLDKKGIDTGIHYPIPLHLQPALAYLRYRKGQFPVAEKASREILSLPMYPQMQNAQVERVLQQIKLFLK